MVGLAVISWADKGSMRQTMREKQPQSHRGLNEILEDVDLTELFLFCCRVFMHSHKLLCFDITALYGGVDLIALLYS